ncbi:PrsW family intramembrane metalloprotease [Micromonospora sp. NBRC 101691]|uniref:PrsW family intramembrane metalloprotease n=1 Tax=Micromonospora sp. NBRC 101691 TaxID=3032198 RepID=UPI0024A0B96D|nr:PrsW family intramembrane metalloprotease [Micromonospora sp. NBRC 101691]GLY26319.1 protease PrsW [Micromonospora sp. NBRC 101691]
MSSVDTTALTAERAAAIRDSGWGEPFRLVQPRNLCFWVFVWGVAAGSYGMLHYYGPALGAYGVGLGTGVLAFALYTIPWLFLLAYHNRYTSLPSKLLLTAFVWGASAATFWLAISANGAILSLYGKGFGLAWVTDWGAGLTAPFTEETSKALALVLLIGLAPRLVRSPYDGLMIGAFAGLGFQISEDVLYAFNNTYANFGADQVGAVLQIILVRGLTGLVGHVLFSAVFCAGLMWLIGRGDPGHRVRGLLLMLAAMAAHSGWDNLGAIGYLVAGDYGAPLLMIVVFPAANLLLLWLTFRLAVPQEQRWLRAVLAPEAAQGVLTDDELTAASGGCRTRRSYLKSRHGHRDKRTARHVLTAANDLARELARSGGRETDPVRHARSEVARLRAPA